MNTNQVVYRYLVYLYLFQVTISLVSKFPIWFTRRHCKSPLLSAKSSGWGFRENIERMKHHENS